MALLLSASSPLLPSKKSPINSLASAANGSCPSSSRIFSSRSASAPPCRCSSSSSSSYLFGARASNYRVSSRVGSLKCEALGEGSERALDGEQSAVYQGVYGPWAVEPSDVREVILYRSGLVTAAASFVLASAAAFLPEGSPFGDILKQDVDFLYIIGASGLGLSLVLIHIYVTPIKRFLQALWAIGVVGSLGTYWALARPLDEGLIQYVIDNPTTVWLIGPLFAALTGLVFKEGLCYGKLEAGILTFVIPAVLLGHLSGFMDNGVKLGLLGLWMTLFVVFAARKFQQPIKDDIGDKSVFTFNALPEEEKKALLQKLEQQNYQQLD